MDNQAYFKDGAARVLSLLKDTFGSQFKQYYDGEPEGIPESYLPCIMVTTLRSVVRSGATGTDNVGEVIKITVAHNTKDDFGADDSQDLTDYKIRKVIMGQSTDGQYLPESILYALRTNITLDDAAIGNEIDIDFDVNQRGQETFTQEGYVTLTIERLALVPSRT